MEQNRNNNQPDSGTMTSLLARCRSLLSAVLRSKGQMRHADPVWRSRARKTVEDIDALMERGGDGEAGAPNDVNRFLTRTPRD